MEYWFNKAKKSVDKRKGYQMFEQSVKEITDATYLSLLLKYVIEQELEPSAKYLHLLLKQGANINFTQAKSVQGNNQENANLLMIACKVSNLKVVEMLLDHQKECIFQKDKSRRNVIHYAIQNKKQEESFEIVSQIFSRYPQFKILGNFDSGNYISLALEAHKPNILQLLINQEIESDYLKNQGLILHRVVELHKNHKNLEKTLTFLKILLSAGCRQDLNDRQENYINYAISQGLLSDEQTNLILVELKPQISKKQLTLETSPQEKLADSHHEEDFWDNSTFNQEQEHHFEVFSQTSQSYELNHLQVSEEMVKIAQEVQQIHNKTWVSLYPYYLKLYQVVNQLYGSIEIIGSFASNLWIPGCDIDFLLIIPEQNPDLFDQIVQTVFSKVKKLGCFAYVKLYLTYKLPMIKLILKRQEGDLVIELFLSSKRNIASQYVAFIHQAITYYPEIQVIYYVIRKILQANELHDHKKGGLKAYGLFLLIYSMRTQYQYTYVSQFLQHFAYYYGIAYEYVEEVIQNEVNYKINIIDPLNKENNMGGKNTDIPCLQETFKKVYYGLNIENEGKKIAYLMDLIKEI